MINQRNQLISRILEYFNAIRCILSESRTRGACTGEALGHAVRWLSSHRMSVVNGMDCSEFFLENEVFKPFFFSS